MNTGLLIALVLIAALQVVGIFWNKKRDRALEEKDRQISNLRKEYTDKTQKRSPMPVRLKTEDRFSPLRVEELLSAFAVGDDDPLLEGVIHVLHALEIERGDQASIIELDPATAKAYSVAAGTLKDAQEELLAWVDRSDAAKKNQSA